MISGTITGDSDIKRAFKSLGVVFGDIGTSPIYTLTVIFLLLKPTEQNVISVLSLILDSYNNCHRRVCVACNEPGLQ